MFSAAQFYRLGISNIEKLGIIKYPYLTPSRHNLKTMAEDDSTGNDAAPLDTKVNGTPFSVLLSQAVKLKSAQEAPLRSKFNSFPTFYQNSIFPRDQVDEARGKDFEGRMEDAGRFKNMGNSALKELRYQDAITCYEMALGVFKYLVNTNPNWKTEGVKDDYIRQEEFETDVECEKSQVCKFLVMCYTNIAVVSLKTGQLRQAIEACNEAIEIDSSNVKALYLRSKARLTPKSAGMVEEDMAVRDLQTAKKLDPKNQVVM